tara:strand:+ start:77 stop:478 length:402 start_codon:yes stop_codon:yes gene_type:complete
MSWENTLQKPEFKKPERSEVAPDSKVVDLERVAEIDVAGNCCEVARTSAVIAINSLAGHKYEKQLFPSGIEANSKIVEEASCKELKSILANIGKINKYPSGIPTPPKGSSTNPLVVECRKIYEEWKECDKDLI